MRLHKLLELVEDLTPTGYSEETLTEWIEQCENGILVDVLLLDPAECVTLDPETDVELAVKKPYDKLYLPYVQAQVAFAQGEISRYENYLALYTAYLDEYARYICRTVYPAGGCSKLSGYYLSAYGLAVENGFEGSEADWLASLVGPPGPQGERGEQGDTGPSVPIAIGTLNGGVFYAFGEDLPEVRPGTNRQHTGKGKVLVFYSTADHHGAAPKLALNDGDPVEIRQRDLSQSTVPLQADSLQKGMPYILTFCGKYWLVESSTFGYQAVEDAIREQMRAAVKRVNGNAPDSAGEVILLADDITTQQSAWQYQGNITDALDDLFVIYQTITDNLRNLIGGKVGSVNSKLPDDVGNVELRSDDINMDDGQVGFEGMTLTEALDYVSLNAESLANKSTSITPSTERYPNNTAVINYVASRLAGYIKSINGKSPDGSGAATVSSNDIMMETGNYEDYAGYSITEAVDNIGQRIDSKGGKVELIRSGNQILRSGRAIAFHELRELLTAQPDFVYLLDGDWAYLTTYIYGAQTDTYQYIRFSSTVIGDLRIKTSSIMVQTTNGGASYTVTSSNINSENVSNKSSDMSVLNDTRYPTTKAVADYVDAKLEEIPFAEEVEFNA